jgi:hypothetical protein
MNLEWLFHGHIRLKVYVFYDNGRFGIGYKVERLECSPYDTTMRYVVVLFEYRLSTMRRVRIRFVAPKSYLFNIPRTLRLQYCYLRPDRRLTPSQHTVRNMYCYQPPPSYTVGPLWLNPQRALATKHVQGTVKRAQ